MAETMGEPFTVPEYDPSMPLGGDTTQVDINLQYQGLEFNYTYIMTCAFLVWMIIPGLGLFYGGLARRKSGLALIFQSFLVTAVVTFQWMFWGYSLAYSRSASPFIGNLANFGLMGVRAAPSPGSDVLPEIVFCFYQLLFAAVTVQILIGGAFERGRILSSLIFSFLWTTVVYCAVACWTWNANGWLYNLPSFDFAGGGPVHIASGCSSLAYALILGKRKHNGEKSLQKPHNTTLVFLGTVFIWYGWFGFNGGSPLEGSVRGMYAVFNTNVAASTGILGWVLVDFIRTKGKFSVVGACEGAIAGLVGITASAGFVHLWYAALIGFLTAVICSLLHDLNKWIRVDEGLDVFKLHGVGGMVGSFLAGIFSSSDIGDLSGPGSGYDGAVEGVGVQVARQLAEIAAIASYSFVVSCILLLILKYIPGLGLRVSDEAEMNGLDLDQFFDEQIGDWSMFEAQSHNANRQNWTQGHDPKSGLPMSSAASSQEKETKDDRETSRV